MQLLSSSFSVLNSSNKCLLSTRKAILLVPSNWRIGVALQICVSQTVKQTMEPSDMGKGSESLNDVMCSRLKNRERQRRYRERKRLKEDGSNTCASNPSSSDPSHLQIVPYPVNRLIEQVVTRVYCPRDWKKDARRVFIAPKQGTSNGFSSNAQSSMGENHMMHSPSGTGELPLVNCARMDNSNKSKSIFARRAWKAEARSKK